MAGKKQRVEAETMHYEGARELTFILIRAPAPFRTIFAGS